MKKSVLHALSLGFLLGLLWLLLSGFFEPFLLSLGFITVALVVLIAHRMDVIDHEGHPIHLGWRIVAYWGWLIWEIVKANIDVARRIINPKLPISPVIFRATTTQGSEFGQVIYANSITLTPGTVSIFIGGDQILVHSIAEELADDLLTGEMDRRVTAVEALPSGKASGQGAA